MVRAWSVISAVLTFVVLPACGQSSDTPDTHSVPDSSSESQPLETSAELSPLHEVAEDLQVPDRVAEALVEPDTAVADSSPDSGQDPASADAEADTAASAFGTISGECGFLTASVLVSGPADFSNAIDFGTNPYDDSDLALLSAGAQQVLAEPNAGGSSSLSEAFSFEVLHRCESADLLETEMTIIYTDPGCKKTDMLVSISGQKVAVSVTRAMSYPPDAPYSPGQAAELLDKKLATVAASNGCVAAEDAWVAQILHVLAMSQAHADAFAAAWDAASPDAKGKTLLVLTVTDGEDLFLY